MNSKMKTVKTAMLTAALALTTAGLAHAADTNPANDSGSFTVRITPNVDLGVTVDTTGANWAGVSTTLDVAQDLASDVLLDAPVNIAMAGNMNNQELTLTGVALNTWVLDTDELDRIDQVRLYALFSEVALGASPAVGAFAGAQNLIKIAATRAGQAQVDEGTDNNHVYERSNVNALSDVDGMSATATRKLWLRSTTPSTSSTDQQAAFTVIVTAVTGTGL